ncbi:MAG: hypothetical protein GC136_07065 [Alphaproteobacteria bacterium]|nr:hypothetical protein [Alphaproteobacteria bacterium]
MRTITVEFNAEFTKSWWERLLKDEDAMNRWLAKLWRTESDGYPDNMEAAEKYAQDSRGARVIFQQTGLDEKHHGELLWDLLAARGITPDATKQPQSVYWDHVNGLVTDLATCAAAFAIGEQFAADRFAYIHAHQDTPADVKAFLDVALPDETYHATSFERISTPEALAAALARHNEAVEMMQADVNRQLKL